MSTPTVPTRAETGQLNKLAVAAIIFAILAAAAIWLLGISGLAVFAVGAGHVSLNQIKLKSQRGRWLAMAALAIGYATAILALISALRYIPALLQL